MIYIITHDLWVLCMPWTGEIILQFPNAYKYIIIQVSIVQAISNHDDDVDSYKLVQ